MNSYRAFFAACILGLACQAAPGATLYVSTTGSDAHPGSGPQDGQAMRSIQAAVDKLQPGDTLLIRGGTYHETVIFPRSGEAGRPITLKAYRD
jgi:pectin methylesterase-like acyl-CoA thioesterase